MTAIDPETHVPVLSPEVRLSLLAPRRLPTNTVLEGFLGVALTPTVADAGRALPPVRGSLTEVDFASTYVCSILSIPESLPGRIAPPAIIPFTSALGRVFEAAGREAHFALVGVGNSVIANLGLSAESQTWWRSQVRGRVAPNGEAYLRSPLSENLQSAAAAAKALTTDPAVLARLGIEILVVEAQGRAMGEKQGQWRLYDVLAPLLDAPRPPPTVADLPPAAPPAP